MTTALLVLALMAPPSSRPWAQGVSEADQQRSLTLYEEGNRLYAERQCERAVVAYEKALRAWSHPSIHFNRAMCQIELGQNVAAWRSIEAALEYGQGPLSEASYREARRYQRILAGGIAFVRVVCRVPGALVTLDGARLFEGPGERVVPLVPGEHELLASKEGFVTASVRQLAPAGVETVVALAPEPIPEMQTVRRFPVWMPWTVFGAGVVVAAAGAPLYASALDDVAAFDRSVAAHCSGGVCGQRSGDAGIEGRARAKEVSAIALWGLGGAALVSGVVLLALNAERQEPIEYAPVISVMPRPDGGLLQLGGHF